MGMTYYRDASQSWRDFFGRRIIRIVPMYWIATTLKLAAALALPVLAVHSRLDPWHILASYLFIPAKNPDGSVYPVLWVGWTLNFEMLFYVLFATALALRVRLLPFLTAAIGVLALAGLARSSAWPAVLRLLDPILLEFLCGAWLASRIARGFSLSSASCILLASAGLALIIMAPGNTDESNARVIFWGIPAFAIVAAAAATKWSPPAWLMQLGDASYSIYLFHGFVMTMIGVTMKRFPSGAAALALGALGVLLSAAVGLVAFRFVETPILRRLNAWFKGSSVWRPQRIASQQ
jgi:peptidoglycan/LPS O-acetylase OafA/YrhL